MFCEEVVWRNIFGFEIYKGMCIPSLFLLSTHLWKFSDVADSVALDS